MPISSELAELHSEHDFLSEQLRKTSEHSSKYADLLRRIDRIKVAIQIRRELSSWRTETVHVVATSRQEAHAIARFTGWPTRKEARKHLVLVRDGILRSTGQLVSRRTYRIWRVKVYRTLKKNEIISRFHSTRPNS